MEKTSFFLDDIKPDFDPSLLLGDFSAGPPKIIERLRHMSLEAVKAARPVALFKMCPVEARDEENVAIGGVLFTSALLRKNLEGLGRVFPYIATEGPELAAWGGSLSKADQILAKSVRYAVLRQAANYMEQYILDRFDLSQISAMNPGSLPREWPLAQQAPLFKVLAPLPEKAGVSLLPNNMMAPELSMSGIFFQTEVKYHNCRLCPMPGCPIRRAEYNPDN